MGSRFDNELDLHVVKLGINYRFGWPTGPNSAPVCDLRRFFNWLTVPILSMLTCVYRKSNSAVTVMKTAEDRVRCDDARGAQSREGTGHPCSANDEFATEPGGRGALRALLFFDREARRTGTCYAEL